jgi:hypothetical protein
MKKNNWIAWVLGLLLVVVLVYIVYINIANSPKPIEAKTGWTKMILVSNIVPKGAIIVSTQDSNLIIPEDRNSKTKTGFISGGVIIVYDDTVFTSESLVWIFTPEKYEFLIKVDDLNTQLNEKMSDLTDGKQTEVKNFYFAGKP